MMQGKPGTRNGIAVSVYLDKKIVEALKARGEKISPITNKLLQMYLDDSVEQQIQQHQEAIRLLEKAREKSIFNQINKSAEDAKQELMERWQARKNALGAHNSAVLRSSDMAWVTSPKNAKLAENAGMKPKEALEWLKEVKE